MIYRLTMNRLTVHIYASDYAGLLKAIRLRWPATCKGNLYVIWHSGEVHYQSDDLGQSGDVCTDAGVVGKLKAVRKMDGGGE
jgi:hypothetical protein